MKNKKNYNSLSVLFVFKKRFVTFIISLLLCITFGSFFVKNQIENIKQLSQNNQIYQVSKEDKFALIKIKKYTNFQISQKLIKIELEKFIGEDKCINEYFLYSSEKYFDIYAIHLQSKVECINKVIESINKSKIINDIKSSFKNENSYETDIIKDLYNNDIASLVGVTDNIDKKDGKPINKHFIYLNKDRLASQKNYLVLSTIISSHSSLNSSKIWIFMFITSFIISIFVVFIIEYLNNIKATFKYKNQKL